MAIFDVIDVVGHTIEGMSVWRYLCSPAYRATVHQRWRDQSRFETGMAIFFFSLSFIFVTLVIGRLGWWAVSSILPFD